MRTSECDMVIVGVGGQGVILISDVIGRAGVLAGKPVRGAETHGMAQRGGSVINHTRIGCRFSPLVAPGSADLLIALEPAEALRFGHFLSPDGVALISNQPVLPVGAGFEAVRPAFGRYHTNLHLPCRYCLNDCRARLLFKADANLRVIAQEIAEILRQEAVDGVGVGEYRYLAVEAACVGRQIGVHLF